MKERIKKYAIVSKNFTRCIEMYSCVCKNIKLSVKHTSTTDHHVSKSVIHGTVLITSCHCPVTGIQQDKFWIYTSSFSHNIKMCIELGLLSCVCLKLNLGLQGNVYSLLYTPKYHEFRHNKLVYHFHTKVKVETHDIKVFIGILLTLKYL